NDVQSFNFNYIDENFIPQQIPQYLVLRVKALRPDGTFEITGSPFDDSINIFEKDGVLTANINGFLWQQTASDVKSLLIHLLDGSDRLTIDPSVHVAARIEAGGGKDTVIGSAQDDSFSGGRGNDVFFSGGGNDLAFGDDGNDLIVGGNGDDSLS